MGGLFFCFFFFAQYKLVASGQSLFYGQMDSSSLNFGINFTLQFRLFKRNSGITQAICDDYLYFQLFNLCLVKLGTFLCLLATENLSLLCFKLIRPKKVKDQRNSLVQLLITTGESEGETGFKSVAAATAQRVTFYKK